MERPNAGAADAAGGWTREAPRLASLWLPAVPLVAAAYAPFLRDLAHAWRVDPYAGHGMFVPAYSAVLLYFDRERLRSASRRREPLGALAVVAALALLWAGAATGSLLTQGLSFVLAVAGLVLWGFGAERLRAAAFPIAFLVCMLPLPRGVVERVTLDVQNLHAWLTSGVLQAAGVPHFRHGIHLELPNTTLVVAEGCNGLRFLLALVTLAAAFAQVSQRTLRRKLLLVALAVPLAVVANGFRVSVLSLAAYHAGPQAAEGLVHHAVGKTVWALALGVLVGAGLLARRAGGRPAADPPARSGGA